MDRAFRLAFRNYSTLFLAVAVVTVTLHLVYSLIFRSVIAVSELHPEIATLGANVKVQDVGRSDLSAFRNFFWVVTAVEVLAIPLLVAAARAIIQVDRVGGVPTVTSAYRRIRAASLGLRIRRGAWGTVAGGAVVALIAGFLFERAGLLVTEVLPDRWLFLGAGAVRGLSRALGAPFFLAAVVVATADPEGPPAPPGRDPAAQRPSSRS